MVMVRPAAVAGHFYPRDPVELRVAVQRLLAGARPVMPGSAVPKAIIAPHAGYIYSGAVAAEAYVRLAPARGRIRRVVVIGPSHRVAFRGLALTTATAYDTPLGPVPIDPDSLAAVEGLPMVGILDAAHAEDHAIEVQLPFITQVLGDVSIVPVVVGDASAEDVDALLTRLWGGPETAIVVSSDLSHYLDYDTCRQVDAETVAAIESLAPERISREQACGRVPVGGLLLHARRTGLAVVTCDVRNSGDTAGPRDRVVGYGAWAFLETEACVTPAAGAALAQRGSGDGRGTGGGRTDGAGDGEDDGEDDAALVRVHGETLLHIAAASIRHGLYAGRALPLDVDSFPPELTLHGAAFVTLTRSGQLRGCIGSPRAWRALVEDVAENAHKAAFADPRFRPLLRHEISGLEVSVSVLTPPRPMAFADQDDLLARIRPGVDGLIVEDQGQRGLFLPSVWDALPDRQDFWSQLKRKAGLSPDHWSATVTVHRFTTHAVKSADLPDPEVLWTTTAETA